jgi:hypothetical protein
MPLAASLLGEISSLASFCGNQGRSSVERQEPAEPDDPNPSTLNPNGRKKSGVGKAVLFIDKPSIKW